MADPEFQIYECSNPECRFRCPNDLTKRKMDLCPLCGHAFLPQGEPFVNQKRLLGQTQAISKPVTQIEVLLDNLRSILNVGSIFRTADGAAVRHIYCCGTTPTPKHPKIAKTSLGAEGFTPWSYYPNALNLVQEKLQQGFEVISLESTENSKSLFNFQLINPESLILLVVGNEVSGIDPAILNLSQNILSIPMLGHKSSLNVAVAFGIAVYTLQNHLLY